jgi:hypothetical protein
MTAHRLLQALAALLACTAGLGLAPVASGLLSPSPTERAQFARGVVRMTDDAIANSIHVLERDQLSANDVWVAQNAIHTLGQLRAEAGVDVLMRHLDDKSLLISMNEGMQPDLGDYFPALRGLVAIGSASSARVLREFRQFSQLSPFEQQKLFWVLDQIEGQHPGCFLIERELARVAPGPAGDTVRAELAQALARYEAYELHPETYWCRKRVMRPLIGYR